MFRDKYYEVTMHKKKKLNLDYAKRTLKKRIKLGMRFIYISRDS